LSAACYRSFDFTRLPSPNKTYPHDIAEIFLIMALNTITIHHPKYFADKKRSNVAEKKRENTNKTINTNKHIQVMIRNTDVIKTGGELSGLEG
jgi:hypothetical protein